jgi:hypothetical protein
MRVALHGYARGVHESGGPFPEQALRNHLRDDQVRKQALLE